MRAAWDSHKGIRVVLAALAAVMLYLGMAAFAGDLGYPLDDGWIHQTYARNLARAGKWEYVTGVTSAGSTAPLWTLLLTVGYVLRLPPMLWTHLLGFASLAWGGLAGMDLFRTLWPSRSGRAWMVGLALVFSWPLVWAAGSGMETLLFIALALRMLALYGRLNGSYSSESDSDRLVIIRLGLIGGLLVLTRPDGLALAALVLAGLISNRQAASDRLSSLSQYVVAAGLPLLPYFAFNLWASGSLWPNTFYAKQAEYAFLWERPLPLRFGQLLYFSLGGPASGWRGISGVQLLLLPGLLVAGWQSVRNDWGQRTLNRTLPLLWAGGHVFLYAWRLPVTYQHGRYLWAAVPVWLLYGLAGWGSLSERVCEWLHPRFHFIWRTATRLVFVILLLAFLLLGAQAYVADVSFINGEMVAMAQWLQQHTAPESRIAAHDIGALGYFAERPILDLAGLISPDVISILGNEEPLAEYVWQSDADYLVTAPGWPYERLTSDTRATLLYSTQFEWTELQGMNNMAVYELERD